MIRRVNARIAVGLLVTLAAVAACEGQLAIGGPASDGGLGGSSSGQGSNVDAREMGDGAATSIASEIQATATDLASDGTSIFWRSSVGTGGPLLSIPVTGGTITTVVPGNLPGGPLVVDDVYVYYDNGGLYRVPKGGGSPPTLVNEPGASLYSWTSLATRAYWAEGGPSSMPGGGSVVIKTAPLQGGTATLVAQFDLTGPSSIGNIIGVTSTTAFLSSQFGGLASFPLSSGVPDGGMPAAVPGSTQGCQVLMSDTDAVYCGTDSSIVRIASDGTMTTLGPVLSGGLVGDTVAIDDTYVYWLDSGVVGTVMRAPKTGGTAEIIARDTSPVAIAVDANAVYWSDVGGHIMRLAK